MLLWGEEKQSNKKSAMFNQYFLLPSNTRRDCTGNGNEIRLQKIQKYISGMRPKTGIKKGTKRGATEKGHWWEKEIVGQTIEKQRIGLGLCLVLNVLWRLFGM